MNKDKAKIGVDEAGRGPLLGPLVIATVRIPSQDAWLKNSDVADSKDLTEQKRQHLADQITRRYNHRAVILSASSIDSAVNQHGDSLTKRQIREIKTLLKGQTADTIIIDAPTKNNPFDDKTIRYEHKADRNYKCVGAASILAKTIRDQAIQRISKETGADIGSGYPSDPTTKAYVREADLDQHFIRSSWEPIQRRKTEREQESLPTT
jgi:ribonuclease HII